jgi:ABC-type transport system substrate-binding protein
MACRSGCPTPGEHRSWGECAQGIAVAFVGGATGTYGQEKALQRNADAYWAARKQGIQPDGTSMKQIETAVALSDGMQKPYVGVDNA